MTLGTQSNSFVELKHKQKYSDSEKWSSKNHLRIASSLFIGLIHKLLYTFCGILTLRWDPWSLLYLYTLTWVVATIPNPQSHNNNSNKNYKNKPFLFMSITMMCFPSYAFDQFHLYGEFRWFHLLCFQSIR